MLYGEGKDYNVAIIVPNYAELKADPNINSLLKDTLEESLKSKNLQDYLAKGIMAHLRKNFFLLRRTLPLIMVLSPRP
jgi:long-subunit acyl-CoA synthetase (AMP-forming)